MKSAVQAGSPSKLINQLRMVETNIMGYRDSLVAICSFLLRLFESSVKSHFYRVWPYIRLLLCMAVHHASAVYGHTSYFCHVWLYTMLYVDLFLFPDMRTLLHLEVETSVMASTPLAERQPWPDYRTLSAQSRTCPEVLYRDTF